MFDIRQKVQDQSGEIDDAKLKEYVNGLMHEFAASPEAEGLLASGGGIGWAASMMEYGMNYIGTTPAQMSVREFEEILFELFPRKVSVEPEVAPAIVNELRAFWQFVLRQYDLPNARPILEVLEPSAAKRLQRLLADPSTYGMAKSFFMMGQKAGFDMTTQEGLDQFKLVYNSQLLANRAADLPAALPREPPDFRMLPPASPLSRDERAAKRQSRKRQRQARKRNRR